MDLGEQAMTTIRMQSTSKDLSISIGTNARRGNSRPMMEVNTGRTSSGW